MISCQDTAPLQIVLSALCGEVLIAVYFDNELRLGAVKIDDKGFNDPLLIDLDGISAEKLIPELGLLWGHFSAQFSRTRQHGAVFRNEILFHKPDHFRRTCPDEKAPPSGELSRNNVTRLRGFVLSFSETAWGRAGDRRG